MSLRIAVVMPRGSTMNRRTANSMETVAHTLREHGRRRSDVRIVCDAGADDPLTDDLLTVPGGLDKGARADAVAQVLRDDDPDYIEYHQQLESSASLARRFPKAINVLYRHTRVKPSGDPISRMRYEARLKAFDHLIFVSEAACAEFLGDYPRLEGRVSAICNPIDSAAWRGDPDQREKLILFSGRAMKEKGLASFCAALATVLDRSPDWRGALMLADWDRHRDWAEPVVATLDRFGDRVEIRRSAPLAEVMAVTLRAAIAVVPSFVAEALGLTALEAHAAGAALISSGRGGLREASGDHAVYVDPPEPDGLATAMLGLIADPAGRVAMARLGQQRVIAVHSAKARADQLDDVREALMARSQPLDRGGPFVGGRGRGGWAMGGRTFLTRLFLGDAGVARGRAARILQLPDRKLMAEAWLPAFAAEGGTILSVGCRAYTAADTGVLEQGGATVWTTDIDPGAARWGRKSRHRTGDICEADTLFGDIRFDAILCNGVLGYGVDSVAQQTKALAAMAAILKPGGRLLLGWNTDKIDDPVAGGLTAPWFEPVAFAGQPERVRFDTVTHVYDSLRRCDETTLPQS